MELETEIQDEAQSIQPEQFVQFVTSSQNIAEDMDERQLAEIAQQVMEDYDMDKDSMSDWFDQMDAGLKLARLVKDPKNYPFEGAANVKYPLVTSAALQFNARAYPAIVPPDRVVMAKVWGNDPQGAKAARADRISEFMSWQLSAEIEEWEEETDKLLVQLPIVGTMIRKWWYDPGAKRVRCRLVEPGKFIVNDKVKNLSDAPRCTEEIPLYPVEIESRIRTGQFVSGFTYDEDEDKQGPQDFIEQHTRIDLDEDGYPEPYVVTAHVETKTIVRIVADFRPEDVDFDTRQETVMVPTSVVDPDGMSRIVPTPVQQEVVTGILGIKRGSYFSSFQFLPSLDGGFHGTGLGLLLGDISSSINTIINMLLDAGHYASLGGGFIGSGLRMKGGSQRMRPGEWKKSEATGTDIKGAIVPLTFPGPDATLFQMLGLLIDAGREIASVQDVITGEQPRQQQTATTTLALIEQGMMVFTAAYKRIFRSLKKEYGLLARINRDTVDPQKYNAFHDEMGGHQAVPPEMAQQGMAPQQPQMIDPAMEFDASDMDIQPVADPRSVTKMQQAAKAQLVIQLADMGLVDRGEALNRIAQAMDIPDVDQLMPQPDPMQQQMAMMQMQAAQADLADKMAGIELKMAQVEETRSAAIENIANAQSEQVRAANEVKKTRMDALMKLLEEDRARLETVLSTARGMEGQRGNAGSSQGNGEGLGSPEVGAVSGLLGGQAGLGGPQAGIVPGGAMG